MKKKPCYWIVRANKIHVYIKNLVQDSRILIPTLAFEDVRLKFLEILSELEELGSHDLRKFEEVFKILDSFLKKNDCLVRIRLENEISFEFSRMKSTIYFKIFSHLRNALIPFCISLLSLERKFKIEFSDCFLKVNIQELFEYLDFIEKLPFPINFKFSLETPNIEIEDLKCLWEKIN